MWALIKLFFDICCLKKAPQDIPYSLNLLKLLVVIYMSVAFLLLSPDEGFFKGLLEIGLEIVLMMAFIGLLLSFYKKSQRYTQALCALLGTDALISVLSLPAMAALMTDRMTDVAGLVILGLIIWHWIVCGHIFKHALEQSFVFGLGLSFLYLFGTYQAMAWLFPMLGSA